MPIVRVLKIKGCGKMKVCQHPKMMCSGEKK